MLQSFLLIGKSNLHGDIYRPQTKFAKVMFLQVSVCPWGGVGGCSGGHVWLLLGGHAWLLWGGMHGCSGGHAWLLLGGVHGCSRGGMRGCSGRGMHGCSQGECVVAWGVCMVAPGGACMVAPGGCAWLLWGGGMRGFFDEIRSMSRRYASYWNAFLFNIFVYLKFWYWISVW